jgi:hypothetical protein
MNKFEAAPRQLEVCAIAKHCPGFLNRQILTLLMANCLGVPDAAFRQLQARILRLIRLRLMRLLP